jgi:3-phosphoshikimate 1-carboxyvinyltransferase
VPSFDFRVELEQLADPLAIPVRSTPFAATLRLPGSKSITNRLYVLAALSRGRSRVRRPLRSDDCDRLLEALRVLGADSVPAGDEGEDVLIEGVDGRFPRGGAVNLGDGGTPTRFMLAAAAMAGAPVVVDGSWRMRERPIAEGLELLRALGADVRCLEAEGRLPVEIRPSEAFLGGELTVGRTASSQFISAIMLVAPWLRHGVTINVREPLTSPSYVELTVDAMRRRTVVHCSPAPPGREAGGTIEVPPAEPRLRGFDATVEPDASGAIYWMAAAALVPGSEVRVPGLDLDGGQPDGRAMLALRALGPTAVTERRGGGGGDGDGWGGGDDVVSVFGGRLERGGELDATDWPDGAMAVAVLAAAGREPVTIRGLRTLRVKETDRIAALATELRRIGCTVEASDEHLTVDPRTCHDMPVLIETYDDHRMAMAFGVLGLVRPGITIHDPACVRKSYPNFWRDLERVLMAPEAF